MEGLIQGVKNHPCLWLTTSPDYKNVNMKVTCWETIAKSLNKTVDTVKKEWKGLRDGFRQAMKSKESKKGQKDIYKKPWQYEKNLEFIKPFMSSRSAEGNTGSDVPENNYEELCSTRLMPKEQPSDDSEVPSVPSISSNARKRKSSIIDKRHTNKVNILSSKIGKDDDLDLFFRSMCETTRKLPALKQIYLRRRINDLVMSVQEEVMMEEQSMNNPALSPSSNHSWSSTSVNSNQQSNF